MAVAVLAGCAARTGSPVSTGPTTTTAAWKTLNFGAVKFDVPAGWPVRDLTKNPTICVRFDTEAVYLGAQGPEPQCPARLLGRANAVQVEPLTATASGRLVPVAGAVNAKGQVLQDQPGSTTTRTIVAAFPKLGVLVTASFQEDPAVAQRIVDSVDAA